VGLWGPFFNHFLIFFLGWQNVANHKLNCNSQPTLELKLIIQGAVEPGPLFAQASSQAFRDWNEFSCALNLAASG